MTQLLKEISSTGKKYYVTHLTLGGADNGNGSLSVLDEKGDLSVLLDKLGITLGNGRKIIGGDGMITSLQFVSKGSYASYSYVGFFETYQGTVEYDNAYVDVYIPSDFVISSAIITLSHTPISWNDPVTFNPVVGYSRNIKIYKVASGKSYVIDNINGGLIVNQANLTEISNALGILAYTPTNIVLGTVEEKTGIDIKPSLSAGHNILVAQSSDAKPSSGSSDLALKKGGIIMIVNITGYTKYKS